MPLFSALPEPAPAHAAALWHWPLRSVLGGSIVIALLMSTQYLVQPFVWRNWPWDEVLAGWVEVARDRVAVAVCIGLALAVASRLPLASLRSRTLALGLAILVGASAGELLLLAAGAAAATRNATAMLGPVMRWGIVAASLAGMWHLWRSGAETSAAAQAVELRKARLERQATEARLEILRGQIEPHFLFNTLATVRRLHQVDPAQGAQLLAHFVSYLRSAQPAQGEDASTLGHEIDLARAYLGVVAQRMNGRLKLHFDVDPALRAQAFPPLTIATLVENAVKHGIAPAPAGGTISISARRLGNVLEAEVADTGVGFNGESGSGIGLANTRARLNTLYGQAGVLILQANVPHGVRATLRVPCARSPGLVSSA